MSEVRPVGVVELAKVLRESEVPGADDLASELLESVCVSALESASALPLKDQLSAIRAVTAALEVTRGKVTRVEHHHEAAPVASGGVPDQR